MIYIFEGLDNVGKGTQISNLKRYLEERGEVVHVLHYSNIKGNNIEERSRIYYHQMFQLMKFAINNGINLILDRAHGGETVYSPIYRNYSGDYVYEIENNFNSRITSTAKLIVFIDDPNSLIKREDGLSFSVELEKKQNEVDRFTEFYEKSNIKNKFLINIKDKLIEQVWEELKNGLQI